MRRERAGHVLQATALVNEAYLQLSTSGRSNGAIARISSPWRRVACGVFSWITPRKSRSSKRGGGRQRLSDIELHLDELPSAETECASTLCALDDALETFARLDPRRAQVVELRYFGGLSVKETATVLEASPQAVMRDWKLAKAGPTRELS